MPLTNEETKRSHFVLLAILLVSCSLNWLTGVGINNTLAVVLKCILYLSGIILFFKSLKPFKAIAIYYSFYVITPVVLMAFYFINGIFFAILSIIALAPIMPLSSEYSKDGIKIYSNFNGFLGSCCEYYATETKMFLFEKEKGTIRTEGPIDFENTEFMIKNDSIIIHPDL